MNMRLLRTNLIVSFPLFLIQLFLWMLLPDNFLNAAFTFLGPVILSIALLVANFRFASSNRWNSFLMSYLFMMLIATVFVIAGYLYWGLKSSMLWHPDGETVYITKLLLTVEFCILTFFSIIIQILVRKK